MCVVENQTKRKAKFIQNILDLKILHYYRNWWTLQNGYRISRSYETKIAILEMLQSSKYSATLPNSCEIILNVLWDWRMFWNVLRTLLSDKEAD